MKEKSRQDMEKSSKTLETHAQEQMDFDNVHVADITFAYRN